MADMSTMRTLIVLITFFGLTFGLYGYAAATSPALFTGTAMSGSGGQGSLVDPMGLLVYNQTIAGYLNGTHASFYNDSVGSVGGVRWLLGMAVSTPTYSFPAIMVETYTFTNVFGLSFATNRQDMHWCLATNQDEFSFQVDDFSNTILPSSSHIIMPLATLDAIYLGPAVYTVVGGVVGPPTYPDKNMSNLVFKMKNNAGTFTMYVTFDDGAYITPSDATVTGTGLIFRVTQDFSDRQTTIGLLDFISGLFQFSPPGVPLPLSIFISGIWYGCVAALVYIIFSVIRSLIPFLPGD